MAHPPCSAMGGQSGSAESRRTAAAAPFRAVRILHEVTSADPPHFGGHDRHFPIEPHFLFPGYRNRQEPKRADMLSRRDVGWHARAESYEAALKEVTAIRLLSEAEFRRLFPEGRLCRERFLGLSKSFTIYHGWD